MSKLGWMARYLTGDGLDRIEHQLGELRARIEERDQALETMRLAMIAMEKRFQAQADEARRTAIALAERIERLHRSARQSAATD